MIRSVFGKIMLLFMAIIMLALFISGGMMSQMLRDSYLNDNATQLVSVAQDIVPWLQLEALGTLPADTVRAQIALKAVANDTQIWVVSQDGSVWSMDGVTAGGLRAVDQPSYTGGTEIDLKEMLTYYKDMLPQLEEGKVVRMTTQAPDAFGTPAITVAVPVETEGVYSSFVFAHRRVQALNDSLIAVYRQVVLAIAISAALGIVLTYILTRSLLRPLSIVAKGAAQLAKGHFDIWLEVRSKDEIGQVADTFNALAQNLKKHEETRDSFVANVSHELRSPLTSIQGLIQGIIDGTIPENEQLHYLSIVLDETKRMNTLVNDLLDLTRLESGQFPMELQSVDVNEMIRRILITFESKIDVKNLMVEVEFQNNKQDVEADPNRLRQVLQNLIDNAVKFADYGGRLRISTMDDGDNVLIAVNNSGEPIPRASLPYLFDRFYKGDESHSRTKEGTGIGLSIVKNILEQHRQKIWVESDTIGGTTFSFTLRKAVPELPQPETLKGQKGREGRKGGRRDNPGRRDNGKKSAG